MSNFRYDLLPGEQKPGYPSEKKNLVLVSRPVGFLRARRDSEGGEDKNLDLLGLQACLVPSLFVHTEFVLIRSWMVGQL